MIRYADSCSSLTAAALGRGVGVRYAAQVFAGKRAVMAPFAFERPVRLLQFRHRRALHADSRPPAELSLWLHAGDHARQPDQRPRRDEHLDLE